MIIFSEEKKRKREREKRNTADCSKINILMK